MNKAKGHLAPFFLVGSGYYVVFLLWFFGWLAGWLFFSFFENFLLFRKLNPKKTKKSLNNINFF
jgi:hypothetical protein